MNQKDVNQRQPKLEPPPPRPADPNADEVRALIVEAEAELERAALAMVRLWTEIHDINKEG